MEKNSIESEGIFMDGKEKKDDVRDAENEEMLKIIYEEAWRQYVHEDEMAEQRDSKYLNFLSLIFSAIGIAVTIFFSNIIGCDFKQTSIVIAIYGIHIFILFVLAVVVVVTEKWKCVNDAARLYVNIRWQTALNIEQKYHIETKYSLAGAEDKLKKEKAKPKKGFFGGFASTNSIINTFRVLGCVLIIADIVSMVVYTVFLCV